MKTGLHFVVTLFLLLCVVINTTYSWSLKEESVRNHLQATTDCSKTISPQDNLQNALDNAKKDDTICLTRGTFTLKNTIVFPNVSLTLQGSMDIDNPKDPSTSTIIKIALDNYQSPGIDAPFSALFLQIAVVVEKAHSAIQIRKREWESGNKNPSILVSFFEAKDDACEYLIDVEAPNKDTDSVLRIFEGQLYGTNINHIMRVNIKTSFMAFGKVQHIITDNRNSSTSAMEINGPHFQFLYPILGSVENPGPLFHLGPDVEEISVSNTISNASLVFLTESDKTSIYGGVSYLYVKEIIQGKTDKFNAQGMCLASCNTIGDKKYLNSINATSSWWGDIHGPAPPGFGTRFTGNRSLVTPWENSIPKHCDDGVKHQLLDVDYLNLDFKDLTFSINSSIMPIQKLVNVKLVNDSLNINEESIISYDSSKQSYIWEEIIEKLVERFGEKVLEGQQVDLVISPHSSPYSFANIVRNLVLSPTLSLESINHIDNPFYIETHEHLNIKWNSTGYMPKVTIQLFRIISGQTLLQYSTETTNKGEYNLPLSSLTIGVSHLIQIQDPQYPHIHDKYNQFVAIYSPPESSSSSTSSMDHHSSSSIDSQSSTPHIKSSNAHQNTLSIIPLTLITTSFIVIYLFI